MDPGRIARLNGLLFGFRQPLPDLADLISQENTAEWPAIGLAPTAKKHTQANQREQG